MLSLSMSRRTLRDARETSHSCADFLSKTKVESKYGYWNKCSCGRSFQERNGHWLGELYAHCAVCAKKYYERYVMPKRRKMKYGKSKRNFTRNAGVHPRNDVKLGLRRGGGRA